MIVTSLLQYLTFLLGSELLFLLPQSPKVYWTNTSGIQWNPKRPKNFGCSFILLLKWVEEVPLRILSSGHISEKLRNFFYDVIMTS